MLLHARVALQAGRPTEAATLLQQGLARDPRNPGLCLEFGALLLSLGRPAEALGWFEQVLRAQPALVPALLGRGASLEQLGWHAEAAESYRIAIKHKPRQAEPHARLAATMLLQDRRSDAARSFQRAASLAERPAASALYAAYALAAQGRGDDAQALLRRAIALEPTSAAAHAELGKLLAEAGDADGARLAFERCLKLNPRAAGHYYDLARIRRLGDADRPLLEQMREVAARDDLHVIHRIMLELAIGKASDDLGDPEQAMSHYLAANQLKGRVRPLDRELIKRRVDWLIHTFTPHLFARFANAGSSDSAPLLVLGMPRSGTTLLESVLASHSCVGAGQELSFWNRCGRELVETGQIPVPAELEAIAQDYVGVLRGLSDRAHVTDKKPDNFFWAGLVHLAFPQARIVHCRRDPLDTAVSIVANFFAPRPDFSTEPADLVFYFRQYERLMAHWRAVLPPQRFLEVDYEQLVKQPQLVVPGLLEFCGLPWEEACMHPELNRRRVNTASLWQVRQPIFTGSVGRWRRYEPWLGELGTLRTPETV